jgi:hypothetical protein
VAHLLNQLHVRRHARAGVQMKLDHHYRHSTRFLAQ